MAETKQHTTNYYNTLITVSEDTKATTGIVPPSREKPTVVEIMYDKIANHPYQLTSDDLIFYTHTLRKGISPNELRAERENFFSKGQACLRCSALPRSYGFGIHCDQEGKVAIYSMDSEEYQRLLNDEHVKKLKAMRTYKKK